MTLVSQAIKDAVFEAIRKPSFDASLPPLSDATWAKLLGSQARLERERLEFVGDALMYATIGTVLYKQIPDGNPHMYTNLRDILHSNAVHSRVAEKLDILAVPDVVLRYLSGLDFGEGALAPAAKARQKIKATADLFETVLGAYYMENGFGSLCDWVGDLYTPLISSAKKAFDKWLSLPKGKRGRPCTFPDAGLRAEDLHATADRKKRKLANPPVYRNAVPLGSRTNIKRTGYVPNAVRQMGTSTSVKAASSSRSTTGALMVKTSASTSAKHRVSPGKMRTPRSTRKTAVQSKPTAIFIDLTLSSDLSDDEIDTPNIRRPSTKAEGSTSSISLPETGSSSRSASKIGEDDLQEEAMLERMLIAHSGSNMDLESSDPEDGEITMDMELGSSSDNGRDDDSDMEMGSECSYLRVYN